MNTFSLILTWIKRVGVYILIPIVLMMRLLSWGKINANKFCLAYDQLQTAQNRVVSDVMSLSFGVKLLFFILESLSTLCLLLALWYFFRIIELYKKGFLFTKEIVILLKKINIIIIAWSIYQLFFDTISSLLISLFKSAGQRYISFSICSDDIVHLFIVLILLLLLQLIQEALKIKTEQDLVV